MSTEQFATAAFYIDLVAERGPLLGLLLTVFAKSHMREDREVERARRALARYMAGEHTVEEGDGNG